jgi:uncharacterized protein (DUF433 family)
MTDTTHTTYRYVTQVPGVQGGRPIIRGTRTPVSSIVGYYKMGLTVEEILEGLPHLTAAQVFEALSYYHDHVEEIEQIFEMLRMDRILAESGWTVGEDGAIKTNPKHGE